MAPSLGVAVELAIGDEPVGVVDGAVVVVGLVVVPGGGMVPEVGVVVAAAAGGDAGAVVGFAVAAGLGVGAAVGFGVGFGVGLGVGLGVGAGVADATIVTDPPARLALNRSRLIPSNVTACVPAGSLPDQVKRTPDFQSEPEVFMAWVPPATRMRTQSDGDPSRLR